MTVVLAVPDVLEDVEAFLAGLCVGVRVDVCLLACLGEFAGEDAAESVAIRSDIVVLRVCVVSLGSWTGEDSGVIYSC